MRRGAKELEKIDLTVNLANLQQFAGRRRLKAAVRLVRDAHLANTNLVIIRIYMIIAYQKYFSCVTCTILLYVFIGFLYDALLVDINSIQYMV